MRQVKFNSFLHPIENPQRLFSAGRRLRQGRSSYISQKFEGLHQIWTFHTRSYILQKSEGSAPDSDFTYTRSDISQKFGGSAPDLDFTYGEVIFHKKLADLHQIWTLHMLEVILYKNFEDLHQSWTLQSRKGPDTVRGLSASMQAHRPCLWFLTRWKLKP